MININARNIYFGIDTAIPCGLLVCELMSNSLKHAFPGKKRGVISILISSIDNGNYNLSFRDDGVGLPKDFNFKQPDSLGTELIQSLVEQLDGTVEINNEIGTEYNINFTELSYKKRI